MKTAFQVCARIIRGIFSPKKPCFETNFGQWVEIYSIIAKVFWQNCQNCILSLHMITLSEIIFLIIGFPIFFRMLRKNISVFWQKVFSRLVKTAFCVSKEAIWGEKKQLFECFETLTEFFRPLARKVISRIVKTAVFALREISWWGFDSDKILSFFIFGH